MDKMPYQQVIENIVMNKLRGVIVYQGTFLGTLSSQLLFIKYYDLPSGRGYQRPLNIKRSEAFKKYLSKGPDALFTPIVLNSSDNWEFVPYDKQRPMFGRLICKRKASLMDGQHRVDGATRYIKETNSDIAIPFMAFHSLDEEHEINLFNDINSTARGIGPSLSKYLRRNIDDLSWIATELLTNRESPFYLIGSIVGKRSKGKHITFSNLYRFILLLTSEPKLNSFSKEEKLNMVLTYFNSIQKLNKEEWKDYSGFKLSHIVCLDALSIAGRSVLKACLHDVSKKIDYSSVNKYVIKLKTVEWSTDGPLKYLKGLQGSKTLSEDLKNIMHVD
jgi:DNA sulfur modification protein DndB